jgi:hypothetical protein
MDKLEIKSIVIKAVETTPFPGDYEKTKAFVWDKVLAVHPNGKRDTHIMGIVGNAIKVAWKKVTSIPNHKTQTVDKNRYAKHANGPACKYYREYAMGHNIMPPDDLVASKFDIDSGSIAPYRTFLKEEGFEFERMSDGVYKVVNRPPKFVSAPVKQLALPMLADSDITRIADEVMRRMHEMFD